MNINSLIPSLALATQLLSIYYSIRLMRYAEKRVITIVFFLVACLMTLRRLISLVSSFSQGVTQVNLFGETVALFISLLILFGIISLARIFKSEEENKKAAASAELRYRSLFDQSPDGVLLINAKGDIVDFNKEVTRQLGYTREEFSKLRISDIDPIESRADIKAQFEKIIKRGKDEFEVKHKTKQGEIRDVLVIVQTLELSGQTFFHTIWRDVTERKQAENEIWESRSMLKQILDSVPQSIFWKDRDSVYLGCNKVFARAIGIDDPEKIIGKTDFDLPWPRNEAEAYRTDDRAVITAGRAKMHIVEPLEQADGSRLWIDTTKVPLVDKQGDIYGVLGVYDNITERKRNEEALKESEFFFKESQRVAAIGSYKTDFIKGVWESSEVLDTIFGIDKNYNRSVQGWLDIVHPDDSDMMGQYLREEVIAKRKPFSKEYRIIRKNDGETRWVYGLGEVKFDSNGKILSMSGTIQDITERRHADEALLESEDKFRSIFEQATDGILIADAETKKFIEANKAMCIMLGYTRDEIVGLSIDDIHPKQDLPAIRESFEKQMRGEITLMPEVPVLRMDGSVFYADINATPLTLGGRQCLCGIFRDITDKQKLEDQLRQAQKMESIGTLAGGIAHDFNNILAAIVGYGHIALMKMAKDDPQRVNIEHMLEAGDRAARLTQSLLLFSRKQISVRKPVDLNEIIRTVDKFLKRVIGEDVECRASLFEEALPILGDAHQIEQILMNLATNARDAMSTGGIFNIATEQVRLDEAFITLHGYGKPGIYGLITISDTGQGMDEVTREHIFEPFFTTKEVGKGTGLGLSIAYGIIKQHEGFINVYSEPGHGTSFKIYLPLISAGMEEKIKQVEEHPRGGTETILLAEDDETVRTMNKAILEDVGYTVIAAVDGQDAVNTYNENKGRIKLLLFDIIMPKKSGKEAYDEIRAIQPDIKILFQSGYAPDLVRQKLLLEDTMPLVFKPVTPMMLLKQVRSVLDQVK